MSHTPYSDEVSKRATSCIQACRGIPTEALEADVVKRLAKCLRQIEHDWDGEPEDMIEARALLKELDG